MQNKFAGLVHNELLRARNKHPGIMHSHHHAYGVILEEVDEYWDFVKADGPAGKKLSELVQIAAMCQRAAEDLGLV